MKALIAIHHRFPLWCAPPWLGERLCADFPQLDVVHLPDYARVSEEIGDTEIYLGWSMRLEQFQKAKRLRWIHATAAAVHQLLMPEVVASDVVITNASTVHGPVVAEHVIALIFALAKRLHSAARHQAARHWAQTEIAEEWPMPREIAGSTLLLVGYGAIGSEVAWRAAALGMRVLVLREHPQRTALRNVTMHGAGEVEALLPQADFVALCAPLTERTTKLLDARRLALLKREACVINVSRGALIDEAALAKALAEDKLGGAGLDVFEHEPLPQDSPLWSLPNVIVTPHTAATTEKMWERHFALIAQNMRRYLAGEPLVNVVDKQRGY